MTRCRRPKENRTRPGGRSARVRAAVLEATFQVLLRSGYEALSIAEIAARAGVHETSIYRRWKTRGRLVVDACLASASQTLPIPDTGSLRGDLIELLREVVRLLTSPQGQALVALVAAGRGDPEHGRLSEAYWARRFALNRTIFERAERRGELRRGLDSGLLTQLLIGPLYLRLLVTGEPLDKALPTRIVDSMLEGMLEKPHKKRISKKSRKPARRRRRAPAHTPREGLPIAASAPVNTGVRRSR